MCVCVHMCACVHVCVCVCVHTHSRSGLTTQKIMIDAKDVTQIKPCPVGQSLIPHKRWKAYNHQYAKSVDILLSPGVPDLRGRSDP